MCVPFVEKFCNFREYLGKCREFLGNANCRFVENLGLISPYMYETNHLPTSCTTVIEHVSYLTLTESEAERLLYLKYFEGVAFRRPQRISLLREANFQRYNWVHTAFFGIVTRSSAPERRRRGFCSEMAELREQNLLFRELKRCWRIAGLKADS